MSISAKAAVVRTPSGPHVMETVEIDDPREGEVLVRIAGVGICHTDLVFAAGLKILKPPAIFGHEGSGVVEQVGPGVTKVKPGDHVVLTFNSCGKCRRCAEGQPAYCFNFARVNYGARRPDGTSPVRIGGEEASAGFFGQSSFATYAMANERNVVLVDNDVPVELLGPLGCGVQTGAGSIMKSLACPAGSSVLVIGGGAVGLSAVLGAVIQGCSTIVVAELTEARRALALELGATHVIDPRKQDIAAALLEILPSGADFAFDTTGRKDVIGAAIGCLAPHGTLGMVGIPMPGNDKLELDLSTVLSRGIRLMGIIEGDAEPDEFIPRMVALYREGRFPFDKLVSTYRLDQINEAIADQHAGQCVKPVLLTA